jgi:hypothetical protein
MYGSTLRLKIFIIVISTKTYYKKTTFLINTFLYFKFYIHPVYLYKYNVENYFIFLFYDKR